MRHKRCVRFWFRCYRRCSKKCTLQLYLVLVHRTSLCNILKHKNHKGFSLLHLDLLFLWSRFLHEQMSGSVARLWTGTKAFLMLQTGEDHGMKTECNKTMSWGGPVHPSKMLKCITKTWNEMKRKPYKMCIWYMYKNQTHTKGEKNVCWTENRLVLACLLHLYRIERIQNYRLCLAAITKRTKQMCIFLFRFLCANAAMDDDVCCSFKMTFKAILPSSVAVKSEKENDYRKTDDFNMHRELERNREREREQARERDGKAISSKRNIRIQQVKRMKKKPQSNTRPVRVFINKTKK